MRQAEIEIFPTWQWSGDLPSCDPETTWSRDELSRFLLSVKDNRLFAAFRLAAMTGMRRGRTNTRRFSKSTSCQLMPSSPVAHAEVVSQPKTASGKRSVALDEGTISALRAFRKRQIEERLRAGDAWHPSESVFTCEMGRPIHPDRFSTLFARCAEGTGLPRPSLHGLRHTHATIALQANAKPKVVSERLGHTSVAFTLDVYAHVIPGMQEDLADTVAELVEGSVGKQLERAWAMPHPTHPKQAETPLNEGGSS